MKKERPRLIRPIGLLRPIGPMRGGRILRDLDRLSLRGGSARKRLRTNQQLTGFGLQDRDERAELHVGVLLGVFCGCQRSLTAADGQMIDAGLKLAVCLKREDSLPSRHVTLQLVGAGDFSAGPNRETAEDRRIDRLLDKSNRPVAEQKIAACGVQAVEVARSGFAFAIVGKQCPR
jgi:hypothetical protein